MFSSAQEQVKTIRLQKQNFGQIHNCICVCALAQRHWSQTVIVQSSPRLCVFATSTNQLSYTSIEKELSADAAKRWIFGVLCRWLPHPSCAHWAYTLQRYCMCTARVGVRFGALCRRLSAPLLPSKCTAFHALDINILSRRAICCLFSRFNVCILFVFRISVAGCVFAWDLLCNCWQLNFRADETDFFRYKKWFSNRTHTRRRVRVSERTFVSPQAQENSQI